MTTATQNSAAPTPTKGGRHRAAGDLAAALPALLATAGATWRLLGLSASYLVIVAGLFAGLAGLILRHVPADLTGQGLGAANRVTLARAALAIPVGALGLRADALSPAGYWWIIALSAAVMILDGVDGRIARRTGTESVFGARFDMELDAALIMALSLLVWTSGKVTAWVILIGLMRYLFVIAVWIWPALGAALPESFRRRVVCVVQGVVLLVAMGPITPTAIATFVAGVGLAMLTYSFVVDVRWLCTNASPRPT